MQPSMKSLIIKHPNVDHNANFTLEDKVLGLLHVYQMRSMGRTAALFCIGSMLVHNIIYARANVLCSKERDF